MTDLDRLTAALADRYRIERELGSGGMATVYLARDLKHNREVAVKVLRPDLAAAMGPDRFVREIEIAAKLTHPHILPLHDSGGGQRVRTGAHLTGSGDQPTMPRRRSPAIALRVLRCCRFLCLSCTYGPEEERALVEQVVRIGDSYLGFVAVRHERFQVPTGLAAFPDGGKAKVHTRFASLHLVDASRRSSSLLAQEAAPDSQWESFRADVVGVEADAVAHLRLTGCPRNGECHPRLEVVASCA